MGGVKMNLVELVQVTSSEEEAEKFLRAKGILKTFDRCPFCGHQKIGSKKEASLNVTDVGRNGA
jgi:predicted CoA-binding protein